MSYLDYLSRIIPTYVFKKNSQLAFWHEKPEINLNAFNFPEDSIGEYYMTFFDKANYPRPFDENGVPLLNYRGKIGTQYNPIAIAQYGLGNFNLYKREKRDENIDKALKAANWLKNNLEKNNFGLYVWNHKFDWEYYHTLRSPWYSALAQGQGISLLLRMYAETNKAEYIDVSLRAFKSLLTEVEKGGVLFIDKNNCWWLEEYIVDPPAHILNGFIWALWGVYDFFLVTKQESAWELWNKCLTTIENKLGNFDTGYWSLYDLSKTKMKNLASPFYHKLHIIQLDVLYRLSKSEVLKEYSDRWKWYLDSKINRIRAYCNKAVFKLFYF